MKNLIVNLKEIVDSDFKIDEENLLRDLHKQFPEKLLFVRELAANSFDANASHFSIFGLEKNGYITLIITDNGDGIENLADYFTVFKSSKEDFPNLIGTFGVGKISMLAVNPVKFELITSTGKECWHAETGSLIKRDEIKISEIKPVKPKGTTIKLTYKPERSFKAEMEKIKSVLENSVAFLPMEIIVHIPVEKDNELHLFPFLINEDWPGKSLFFYRTFTENINNCEYEIIIGFGKTLNALYQNKVFITDKYNLFEPNSNIIINGLCIMMDSHGFELPMGRHAIINTEVLDVLSDKLIPHIQTSYKLLYSLFKRGNLPISNYDFDVLTSDLIFYFNTPLLPWLRIPVFKGVEQIVYSFNDLQQVVASGKSIYIADANITGVDFGEFNKSGIVLANEQHGKCSELIKTYFSEFVLDLNAKDLIMEEPARTNNRDFLSKNEKKFQEHLGFHKNFKIPRKTKSKPYDNFRLKPTNMNMKRTRFSSEINFDAANLELESIKWRVSKLVQRDGKTQCKSHLFLFKKGTIILNLYHPKIAQLVALTEINARLSAHFAMAVALDTQSVLPHIDSEQRQNLLLIDAISRINDVPWSDIDDYENGNNMLFGFNDDIN